MRLQNSVLAKSGNTGITECFKALALSLFCNILAHFVIVCMHLYAVQMSREALNRYLFYCNRYMNHMQSLKFENKVSFTVESETLLSKTSSACSMQFVNIVDHFFVVL